MTVIQTLNNQDLIQLIKNQKEPQVRYESITKGNCIITLRIETVSGERHRTTIEYVGYV
jgi:hypothetical protein